MSGTIGENISLGAEWATMDDIIAAAKRAYIHEFVSKLPKGYDTLVGTAGSRLSGGQEARIAAARGFLRASSVVVFDEPTGSLDAVTSVRVMESIASLRSNSLVIVVCHDVKLIAALADQLVVLRDGVVEAIGSHESLMTSSKTYQSLWLRSMHEPTAANES